MRPQAPSARTGFGLAKRGRQLLVFGGVVRIPLPLCCFRSNSFFEELLCAQMVIKIQLLDLIPVLKRHRNSFSLVRLRRKLLPVTPDFHNNENVWDLLLIGPFGVLLAGAA